MWSGSLVPLYPKARCNEIIGEVLAVARDRRERAAKAIAAAPPSAADRERERVALVKPLRGECSSLLRLDSVIAAHLWRVDAEHPDDARPG